MDACPLPGQGEGLDGVLYESTGLCFDGPTFRYSEVNVMEYNVIDADGHILEPPDLWENYMDPKYRDTCPKMLFTPEGGEILRIEGDDAIDLARGKKPIKLGALGTFGARAGGIN